MFYSRITAVVCIVLGIVLLLSVYERYTIEREMAERRHAAEEELVELHARKAELETKVEYVTADHGIEAEIRKHFDVAKEGEQVVIIVDEREEKQEEITEEEHESRSFWSRFIPW